MKETTAHDSFSAPAAQIHARINVDIKRYLPQGEYQLPTKLALACRILADRGHARTLAGQVTVRAAEADTFWTTNWGHGLAEARISNVVRIDEDMNVLEGAGMANPATRFHMWIYRARPALRCIVHTHPPFCSVLAATGEPLAVAHMDATPFFENCAVLREWPGVPLANEEGRIISEAIGDKSAILLANHGMLTAATTIEEAIYLAVLLEDAAQLQVVARSTGAAMKPIDPRLAREARDFLLNEAIVTSSFHYWARQASRMHPEVGS